MQEEAQRIFGLQLKGLFIDSEGFNWTPESEQLITHVEGEIGNLVLKFIGQGINIKVVRVSPWAKVRE